jgi:hypothetical protein
MKLYATVASERATKGQGGEYLVIEIAGKRKDTIAYVVVEYEKRAESEAFPVITIASAVEVREEKHNAGFYRLEQRIKQLKGEKQKTV